MPRLANKVAIITGVGAGIGEAIAIRFAEEGARLVLNDISETAGQAAVKKIRDMGGEAVLAVADISQEASAREISETAVKSFGGIDILVNNAADFTQKSVEQAAVADWQKVLGVNVIGTALVSKHAIPHMKARGSGSIVNLASMSAVIAQPDFATYNASKGAILTMTKCMALDLAPFKIRVNSICPGCILTSASYREIERLGLTFEQWRDRVAPLHMLNRLGEPREVANAALFLASDEASFITSAHLMVDGGYTGR
jgi:NAD(P)-dependent dehydrogenase (short-subunit alcohol dehydrogenase family)